VRHAERMLSLDNVFSLEEFCRVGCKGRTRNAGRID
jgi:NAD-dependent DNA ligase